MGLVRVCVCVCLGRVVYVQLKINLYNSIECVMCGLIVFCFCVVFFFYQIILDQMSRLINISSIISTYLIYNISHFCLFIIKIKFQFTFRFIVSYAY